MIYRLIHADVFDGLRQLADGSIDSVVTDPPYGLEFMGKEWDGADGFRRSLNGADVGRANVFGRNSRTSPEYRATPVFQQWCEAWALECLRVLKPGGHLIAFGGTRTYHRLACAVEDAGFEIRDQLQWLYGSGFPKSRNLSGDWQGWGTALKPANEPCVLARKPLSGTVAANVRAHGTGALNIAECRIAVNDEDYARNNSGRRGHADNRNRDGATSLAMTGGTGSDAGRWPANVLLDEEAAAMLDAQSGTLQSGNAPAAGFVRNSDKHRNTYAPFAGNREEPTVLYGDAGGASRFFYCAKPDRAERNEGLHGMAELRVGQRTDHERDGRHWDIPGSHATPRANHHPTVKPVDLMRWLVRLVTPPGGTVLDHFAGSGTTGMAALVEGFDFVGIEREADYIDIARRRIGSVAPLLAEEIPA